jgi:hypothetical protein
MNLLAWADFYDNFLAWRQNTMHLTLEERETTITWSAAEKVAHVSSADPTMIRRIEKRGHKATEQTIPTPYKFYEIPTRCIRIGRLEKRKAPKGTSERLATARLSQKTNVGTVVSEVNDELDDL